MSAPLLFAVNSFHIVDLSTTVKARSMPGCIRLIANAAGRIIDGPVSTVKKYITGMGELVAVFSFGERSVIKESPTSVGENGAAEGQR